MANHTRAPGTQNEQVTAIINELRRTDARSRLLMLELIHAFDRFDRLGARLDSDGLEPTHQKECGKALRAKVEAIRNHLFPKRG